jgi:hypothetical protein
MIKSYTNILHKVEKVKFEDLLDRVSDKRKQQFMKNLEEMQNRNIGLPGVNSRGKFKDSYHKLEYFRKFNMYNVSNLIKQQNLIRPKNKKMTENQYTHLLKYLNRKRVNNLRTAAKNRFKTQERPNFSHFGSATKNQWNAWEDFSMNPRTTRKLVSKIKKDMKDGEHREMEDQMRLNSQRTYRRLKRAFINNSIVD